MAKQQDVNAFIAEHKSEIKGKTVKEVIAAIPFYASEAAVRIALIVNRIKPKRPSKATVPYDAFNWNLTDKDLAEAWGIPASRVASYRWEHDKPQARWDYRDENPTRKRSREREKAKAAAHFDLKDA